MNYKLFIKLLDSRLIAEQNPVKWVFELWGEKQTIVLAKCREQAILRGMYRFSRKCWKLFRKGSFLFVEEKELLDDHEFVEIFDDTYWGGRKAWGFCFPISESLNRNQIWKNFVQVQGYKPDVWDESVPGTILNNKYYKNKTPAEVIISTTKQTDKWYELYYHMQINKKYISPLNQGMLVRIYNCIGNVSIAHSCCICFPESNHACCEVLN